MSLVNRLHAPSGFRRFAKQGFTSHSDLLHDTQILSSLRRMSIYQTDLQARADGDCEAALDRYMENDEATVQRMPAVLSHGLFGRLGLPRDSSGPRLQSRPSIAALAAVAYRPNVEPDGAPLSTM